MSGAAGAAPPTIMLGLDLSGPWHQKSSEAYPLTSSVNPPGGQETMTRLRLPALVSTTRGADGRSSMARLSTSEPSLLTTNGNVSFEGFSSSRRHSVLQKRPPFLAPFSKSFAPHPCKSCLPLRSPHPHHLLNQPAYLHFSKAIQPCPKPRPAKRHLHKPAPGSEPAQAELRPSVMPHSSPSMSEEPLFVVGRPCPLSFSERAPQRSVTGPARTQLHVFLPSEAEGEEVDSESVDEGFMDELDSKITSLKLQQGAPKTVSL